MDNQPVVEWARQNLAQRIDIRPVTQNRLIMGLAYSALLFVPVAFVLVGLAMLVIAPGKTTDSMRAIVCGLVLLVPFGGIILLASYVRRSFAGYLDANGAYGRAGLLDWKDLQFVDHVSRYIDRGEYISDRKIEDNDLKLVFANGSVTIPPLIKDRERIWSLVHSIPCEHRVDGEIREQ